MYVNKLSWLLGLGKECGGQVTGSWKSPDFLLQQMAPKWSKSFGSSENHPGRAEGAQARNLKFFISSSV